MKNYLINKFSYIFSIKTYFKILYNRHCIIENNFKIVLSTYDKNECRIIDYFLLQFFISLILYNLRYKNISFIQFWLKYRLLNLINLKFNFCNHYRQSFQFNTSLDIILPNTTPIQINEMHNLCNHFIHQCQIDELYL